MPFFENYPHITGSHPKFTSLANILTAGGVLAPHSGEPFSEAMLLGLSGGLGCTYILWEFKSHGTAQLTTGFTYRGNYFKEGITNAIERVGAKVVFRETAGAKSAAKHLDEALDCGQIPLSLLDQFYLPHRGVPNHLEGCGGLEVTICGREGDGYLVQDRGIFQVSAENLAAGRGRGPSYKNRLVLVEPGAAVAIAEAIRAGITDCANYLSQSSTSFSIPAIAKWAKIVTDEKNKKGWRKVFAEGRGLYSTLVSTYMAIEQNGSGGLRSLYADFLAEADGLVGGLEQAQTAYHDAAAAWTAVAETAISPFPQVRELCDQRWLLLAKSDSKGLAEVNAQLEASRVTLDGKTFEPDGLFEELQKGLFAVVDAEKAALETLRAWL